MPNPSARLTRPRFAEGSRERCRRARGSPRGKRLLCQPLLAHPSPLDPTCGGSTQVNTGITAVFRSMEQWRRGVGVPARGVGRSPTGKIRRGRRRLLTAHLSRQASACHESMKNAVVLSFRRRPGLPSGLGAAPSPPSPHRSASQRQGHRQRRKEHHVGRHEVSYLGQR